MIRELQINEPQINQEEGKITIKFPPNSKVSVDCSNIEENGVIITYPLAE